MSVFWFATSVVKVWLGLGTKTACLGEQIWPVIVSNSPSRLPFYEVLRHCNNATLLSPSILSSFIHRSRIAHVRKIWSFYEFEQTTDGLVFLRGNDPLINSLLMHKSPAMTLHNLFDVVLIQQWLKPTTSVSIKIEVYLFRQMHVRRTTEKREGSVCGANRSLRATCDGGATCLSKAFVFFASSHAALDWLLITNWRASTRQSGSFGVCYGWSVRITWCMTYVWSVRA